MKTNLLAPTCRPFSSLILASLVGWSGLSQADIITNLAPAADTCIRNEVPDSNFGAFTNLLVGVGNFGSPVNRVLLRFSLADVPVNATITAASLRLVLIPTPTSAANFDLHRLLVDWGEGTGSVAPPFASTANDNEATWNARFHPSILWSTAGGEADSDYVSTPSATASLPSGASTNTFTSDDLVSDVQFWLANPGANFGWMLIAAGEPAGTGKRIGSRDDLNPNVHPVLVVQYTVPLTISGVALSNNAIRFSFNAETGHTYAVEYVGGLPDTNWIELTNYPAPSTATNLVTVDSLTGSNRFYRIRTP